MPQKIRLGLIGCGGMGEQHSARFDRVDDRVTVSAAAEIDAKRLAVAGRYLPQAKLVTDYHELLDDVDAVLIALPHHLHHPATLDCLAAGKHVLLEKPMANSEQQCLEIIAAQKRSGCTLMIAYCMRFHPLVIRMKQLLDEKRYGECFQLSIWTEQFTDAPEGHWFRSAEQLGKTRADYDLLLVKLNRAADKMDPVLALYRDQILFLKHNLNARAISSLDVERARIEITNS